MWAIRLCKEWITLVRSWEHIRIGFKILNNCGKVWHHTWSPLHSTFSKNLKLQDHVVLHVPEPGKRDDKETQIHTETRVTDGDRTAKQERQLPPDLCITHHIIFCLCSPEKPKKWITYWKTVFVYQKTVVFYYSFGLIFTVFAIILAANEKTVLSNCRDLGTWRQSDTEVWRSKKVVRLSHRL